MTAELVHERPNPPIRLLAATIVEGKKIYRVEVAHRHTACGSSVCEKLVKFEFEVMAVDFFAARCECGEDVQVDPVTLKMFNQTLLQNSIHERLGNRPRKRRLKSSAV